jgi:hypothetical protein
MKRIVMTLAALAFLATNAMAFSLGGYQGPVKFKYSNFEFGSAGNNNGIIDRPGETLSGIGLISQIIKDNGSNTVLWDNTTAPEELTIQFGGYVATALNPNAFLGGTDITFSQGFVNVYLDPAKNFSAAGGTLGASGYNDGSLFLQTVGASATPGGPTLISNVSRLGTTFTGFGSGFLEILGGSFASAFSPDFWGPNMDLKISSSLNAPGVAGWPITSEDPVRGNIVPEPGTLVLLGAGMIGLIGLKRRRG